MIVKRILLICLVALFLLVSCVTPFSGITYYSDKPLVSNKAFISVDETTKTINGESYLIPAGYTMVAVSDSQTVKLGTIENKEVIKNSLVSKGFSITSSKDSSDLFLVVESITNPEKSEVYIGFYLTETEELLFLCKGVFGTGYTMQDDLNMALQEALKSVPYYSAQ